MVPWRQKLQTVGQVSVPSRHSPRPVFSVFKGLHGVVVFGTFLYVFSDKTPLISNLRMEGFLLTHSLRVQSFMAGKVWQQENDVAG